MKPDPVCTGGRFLDKEKYPPDFDFCVEILDCECVGEREKEEERREFYFEHTL